MAAIAYAYDEQLTQKTHTGDTDWTDVPDSVIADVDITDSALYLLVVNCKVSIDSGTNKLGVRVVHGTVPTVFPGSQEIYEIQDDGWYDYVYAKEFTASALDGENIIKCQFATLDNDARTVKIEQITMTAFKVDGLAPGDYFYAEDDDVAAPVPLTTSFVDFAKVTFTPSNTNDEWLLLYTVSFTPGDASNQTEARLRRDGSEAIPTEVALQVSLEGEDTGNSVVCGLSRAYTLSAAEHVFAVQARHDAGVASVHNYSAVAAIRLNAFQNFATFWNADAVVMAVADTPEEVGNIEPTIAPVNSDVFVFGSAVLDVTSTNTTGRLFVQVGGITSPVGRDDNDSFQSFDSTDEGPMITVQRLSSQSGALDIDLDAQASATIGVEDRSLVAFSAELVAAPEPPAAASLPEYGQIRTAIGDPPVYGATILRS